jgi:hypothetical protein
MSDRRPGDAVRQHYLETLARRAQAQPEPVRRILEGKLTRTMAERQARMEATDASRNERIDQPSPLADLIRDIAQQTNEDIASDSTRDGQDLSDLKSLRYFRASWTKLSTDHSVAQALATGPSNAGPLNSHALILRSLESMRDTAPAYLTRFMSYANALLWLEQANNANAPPKKSTGRGEGNKKRKSDRA